MMYEQEEILVHEEMVKKSWELIRFGEEYEAYKTVCRQTVVHLQYAKEQVECLETALYIP